MSPITTHVLDTALGRPAAGVPVTLSVLDPDRGWSELARATTDGDGRVRDLLPGGALALAVHRLVFDVDAYARASGRESFYPEIAIAFRVAAADQHYHVPLLLSPFGYSTYRGS